MEEIVKGVEWSTAGIADLFKLLSETLASLPSWFAWLPTSLITALYSIFAMVAFLRIVRW